MRLSTKMALTFLLGASVPIVLAIWFTQRRAREEGSSLNRVGNASTGW